MRLAHIVCIVIATPFFVSQTNAQWVQLGQLDRGIGKIAVGGSGLFVVTADSGSVLQSTDGGTHWSQLIGSGARTFAAFENGTQYFVKADLLAGPDENKAADSLYRSTDGGLTWALTPPPTNTWDDTKYGYDWEHVKEIQTCLNGNVLISMELHNARDGMSRSYISTDNGETWEESVGGAAFAFRGDSVITDGGSWEFPGGALDATLWLSSDGGVTWDSISSWGYSYSSTGPGWFCPLAWCSNGNIFSSTGYGRDYRDSLTKSMDMGISWSAVSNIVPSALLALPQGGLLVGTDTTGVYLFSDDGDSLGALNEGLTGLHIHTIALGGNGYAYVGTDNGVWRRPVSELVVSVNSSEKRIAREFSLSQNYPNPFNPSTRIQFEVSKSSVVSLHIYDMLGREVALLVNEQKPPGRYEVTFDATMLASGIYFSTLKAGPFVQTRRMLLLR